MERSLQRGILALLYADDLVGISYTADGLQSDIIDPCAQYARRHRYRANVPKCGVMVCGPAALVQGLPARTYTWGQTEIPMVLEYKHLGITITPDGRPDTHIKHVITQGNARVLQMGKLLRVTSTCPCALSVRSSKLHYAHCLSMAQRCLSPLHSMVRLFRVCS